MRGEELKQSCPSIQPGRESPSTTPALILHGHIPCSHRESRERKRQKAFPLEGARSRDKLGSTRNTPGLYGLVGISHPLTAWRGEQKELEAQILILFLMNSPQPQCHCQLLPPRAGATGPCSKPKAKATAPALQINSREVAWRGAGQARSKGHQSLLSCGLGLIGRASPAAPDTEELLQSEGFFPPLPQHSQLNVTDKCSPTRHSPEKQPSELFSADKGGFS